MRHPNRKVALIVETSLSSGREILRGIGNFAHQTGNWHLTHGARGLQESTPDWLADWNGDGIIARIQSPEMAHALSQVSTPVVDVLGVVENSGFPLVHVDDASISQTAARYFSDRDFRHFGFLGIAGENWSERRRDGFRDACEGDVAILETSRARIEDSELVADWLRDLPKPAGVLVASDQLGLGLLEACRSGNFAVPEQVAVVGVDNDLPLCEISSPQLSSIRAGHFRVGFEAARLLENLMQGGDSPEFPLHVPPTGLVTRGSSDTHAIEDPVVARGVHFIREHLAEPITTESVAREAGVSRTLLQRRFRLAMKQTVREFLIDCRLRRARILIETSDLTLADIAIRSGFKHQEYLGDVFKRRCGETPGQVRNSRLSEK